MGYLLLTLIVVLTTVSAQGPREPREGAGPPDVPPPRPGEGPILISQPPIMPGPKNMGSKNETNCPPRTGREWVCMVCTERQDLMYM